MNKHLVCNLQSFLLNVATSTILFLVDSIVAVIPVLFVHLWITYLIVFPYTVTSFVRYPTQRSKDVKINVSLISNMYAENKALCVHIATFYVIAAIRIYFLVT